jgi:heptosyltransferase-1
MLRILLVKTSSLGDVVHNFPAATDIRYRLPNAHISWAVEEAYAPLVALHPAVDDVVPVAVRRWRKRLLQRGTWHELRDLRHLLGRRPFDRIVDTQGLVKSALITRLATGERIGLNKQSAREPLAARFYDTTFHVPRDRHAVERNRRLVAMALGYRVEGPPDYGFDRAHLVENTAAIGERRAPYAVLLHGTARREKQWSEESWGALAVTLRARGLELVLPWGTTAEQARSERIARAIDGVMVPPRRSLVEVARLLAGARLVVGIDTGLLHLAVALQVPTVAIFLSTEPGLTGPLGQGRYIVCGAPGRAPSVDELSAAIGQLGGP